MDAYTRYLQARFELARRTPGSVRRAANLFREAIERDREYAPAHAGLATSYVLLERYGVEEPGLTMPQGKAAARRAIVLDPSLPEAHTALAYALMMGDWDRTGAEEEFRRAIALDPGYAPAHHFHAWFLAHLGRADAAVREIDVTLSLDPLSLISNANRGTFFYFARRFDEAEAQLRRTLEMDPSFPVAYQWLGRVHEAEGRHAEAVASHRQAADALGDDPESIASLGHAVAGAGDAASALELLARLERLARERYVSPYWTGLLRFGLGDAARALAKMDRALAQRTDWLLFAAVDPIFDPVREIPGFRALLEHIEAARGG